MPTATVLVVHDLPDYLNVLAAVMRSCGCRVIEASDGQTGLDAAARHRPELVICDVAPGAGGAEFCRALRSDSRLRETPVLLVAANRPDCETIQRALRAGADDYVEAMNEPMRLIAKVARLIQQRRRSDLAQAEEIGDSRAVTAPWRTATAETIIVVEADKTVRAIARRALLRGGYTVLDVPDPVSALAVAERSERPVDLLVADVMMFEMSGMRLGEEIREMSPYLKILLMAGYIDDIALRYKEPQGGMAIVQKPFDEDTLTAIVWKLLRGES